MLSLVFRNLKLCLICKLASHNCTPKYEVLLTGGNLTLSTEVHTVLIALYHFTPHPGFAVLKMTDDY